MSIGSRWGNASMCPWLEEIEGIVDSETWRKREHSIRHEEKEHWCEGQANKAFACVRPDALATNTATAASSFIDDDGRRARHGLDWSQHLYRKNLKRLDGHGVVVVWNTELKTTPGSTLAFKSAIQMFTENSTKMCRDGECRGACLHEISNPNKFCIGRTKKGKCSWGGRYLKYRPPPFYIGIEKLTIQMSIKNSKKNL